MKKFELLLAGMMLVSVAGCNAQNAVSSSAASEETVSSSVSSEEEKTEVNEVTEETKEGSDVPAGFDPAGDYEDEWSQRAGMHIEKQSDGTYIGTVHWGGSASETAVWTYTGTWDPENGELVYNDCKSSVYTYSETGEETETITYEGGSGRFRYVKGYLKWMDDNDPQGIECRFVKRGE